MIPKELRNLTQWVSAGSDKVPISPQTGAAASVADRKTWGSYNEAIKHSADAGLPHVGFVLSSNDPYTIIDLDKPQNKEQEARHQLILEKFESYSELSQSGKGVHIIARGNVPRGVKRDKVEVYSTLRYMICTGNALKQCPITDQQILLDVLFEEMSRDVFLSNLQEFDSGVTDEEVVTVAMNASNADKFNRLCRGDWQSEYQSQSEADFALMSMFAFYTRSNEQAKRLFRMSALGKREKALREKYLDTALRKIRVNEVPPVDFTELMKRANGNSVSTPVPTVPPKNHAVDFPPGFVGELAQYIYHSSTRPVPEVGIAAAIGLCAGVIGRQYNISGTGLNQYLILLAKTGVGKEGMANGIERLVKSVREEVPALQTFLGPGAFASGQAMVRTLDEKPCFVSILGEFGLLLQAMTDSRAGGNSVVLRRVMLDLYSKSGKSSILYSSAYSDKEKNTKTLFAPAMTLLGESTPETFYGGLDQQQIADGLIPRFLVMEYKGERPDRNRGAFESPPEVLRKRFADFISTALQMQANNSWQEVQLSSEAEHLLDNFDRFCDRKIRDGQNDALRQLWNRAHLKALRLAGLLAATDRQHEPVVNEQEAQWAMDLVIRDTTAIAERFDAGDIGSGESVQVVEMKRLITDYISHPYSNFRGYNMVLPEMVADRAIPHAYLQNRVYPIKAFKDDRRGVKNAVNDVLEHLMESGILFEMPKEQVQQKYGCRRKMYGVGEI